MSNQTYTKLKALHLSGMAECYKEMVIEREGGVLTAEEVLTLMVDREEDKRAALTPTTNSESSFRTTSSFTF